MGVLSVTRREQHSGCLSTGEQPCGRLSTEWGTDPWARGAYSAIPPGVDEAVREVISRTTVENRIALAGEYADPRYPATVQGAYVSGRTAAERVRAGRGSSAIVVGAGMAGLAAARELTSWGISVRVLEARERIGGRILTDRSLGVPVDLGASWVHGPQGNPLVALASQAGLDLIPCDWNNRVVRRCRDGADDPAAASAINRLKLLLDELGGSGGPPPHENVAGWLAERGWSSSGPDAWAVATVVEQDWARDADTLGVRAVSGGVSLDGGDDLIAGGYDRVPALLAHGLDIQLGVTVVRVGVRGRQVEVTRQDGSVEIADSVVIAVPLALLQAGLPIVTGLPENARSAIGQLVTGHLEKIVLRYERVWWGEHRVIGAVEEGTDPAARRWTTFCSHADVTGAPILVGFAGGSAAQARPSGENCAAEAHERLRRAYGAA